MEKEFVPYKLALKLKKLGFNEPCFAGYRDSNWIGSDGPNSRYFHVQHFANHQFDDDQQECCSAPTFSQAFRWFREKHDLTWEQQFTNSQLYLYIGEIAYPEPCLEHFKVFDVADGKYNETVNIAKNEVIKGLIELIKNK